MFIRASNGQLINLDKVKTIYVNVDKDNICSVKAARMDDTEIALYKDKELECCLEYMNSLADKIAMKVI